MSYTIDDKFLCKLLNDMSRSIVGRLCEQNEIVEQNSSLNKNQSVQLLKQFNKALIYEGFRELEKQIKAYQSGQTFAKFKIYSPTDLNKPA